MTNQTITNMDEVILKLKQTIYTEIFVGEYKHESTQIAKTLINTYQTMLNTFLQMSNTEFKESKAMISLEKQACEIYNAVNTIESVTIPKLMSTGEFKGVDNMSLVVDKARKIIRDICPRKDFSESFKAYTVDTDMEELLNTSIENGMLIHQINDILRGKGKTSACVKKAHELDCLILTATSIQSKRIDEIARDMNTNVTSLPVTKLNDIRFAQYKIKANNGIIIDEAGSEDVLNKLKACNLTVLGGFSS